MYYHDQFVNWCSKEKEKAKTLKHIYLILLRSLVRFIQEKINVESFYVFSSGNLVKVEKRFKVMFSTMAIGYIVHTTKQIIIFGKSNHGLFYHDTTNKDCTMAITSTHYTLVKTVRENERGITPCQFK